MLSKVNATIIIIGLPSSNFGAHLCIFPAVVLKRFFGWWWCSQTPFRDSLDRSGLSSQKRKHEQNILQMISGCSQTLASLLLDSSLRTLPYTSFIPSPAFISIFKMSSGRGGRELIFANTSSALGMLYHFSLKVAPNG